MPRIKFGVCAILVGDSLVPETVLAPGGERAALQKVALPGAHQRRGVLEQGATPGWRCGPGALVERIQSRLVFVQKNLCVALVFLVELTE